MLQQSKQRTDKVNQLELTFTLIMQFCREEDVIKDARFEGKDLDELAYFVTVAVNDGF